MTKPNPDEKLLEEMIEEYTYDGRDNSDYGTDDAKQDRAGLKALILSNFVSKDKVREALKDEETVDWESHQHNAKIEEMNATKRALRSKLGVK